MYPHVKCFLCLTGVLPAGHGVVSEQHLLAQLLVLDPPGELHVCEVITQQLWPKEALQGHTEPQTQQ